MGSETIKGLQETTSGLGCWVTGKVMQAVGGWVVPSAEDISVVPGRVPPTRDTLMSTQRPL